MIFPVVYGNIFFISIKDRKYQHGWKKGKLDIFLYLISMLCVFLSITPRISFSNKKKRVIHIFVLTVATIGLEQWFFWGLVNFCRGEGEGVACSRTIVIERYKRDISPVAAYSRHLMSSRFTRSEPLKQLITLGDFCNKSRIWKISGELSN